MWTSKFGRPIELLTVSMFTSTIGTNILLVALSVYFFEKHQSAMAAAGVYVAQFTPIIVLMPVAWRLCDWLEPRQNLPLLEALSAIVTVMVGISVVLASPPVTYALLFGRGFLDMTTKAARTVALKSFAETEKVSSANIVVTAASYLGQAVGAMIGFLLIGKVGIITIASVDAASYALSGLICKMLPPVATAGTASGGYIGMLRRGKLILQSDRSILKAFWILTCSVVFLQGYNQVARLWIPLAWLQLPANSGAISEAIGVIGITTGLIIAATILSGQRSSLRILLVVYVVASVLLFLPFQTKNTIGCFFIYFLFMASFEVAYMMAMSRLLVSVDRTDLPCLMVLFYGFAFGGMTLSVIVLGIATDIWGLPPSALSLGIISILAVLSVGAWPYLQARRN
jgi:predicted MFS family arabinose efflux permease